VKKNAHLHIVVDTKFLESLKVQARIRGISVSELSRQKLSNNLQLDVIENLVRKMFESF
jgi:hypothetical protein